MSFTLLWLMAACMAHVPSEQALSVLLEETCSWDHVWFSLITCLLTPWHLWFKGVVLCPTFLFLLPSWDNYHLNQITTGLLLSSWGLDPKWHHSSSSCTLCSTPSWSMPFVCLYLHTVWSLAFVLQTFVRQLTDSDKGHLNIIKSEHRSKLLIWTLSLLSFTSGSIQQDHLLYELGPTQTSS